MMDQDIHVIVDSREPGSLVAAVNGSRDVTSWSIDRLPAGDLQIGTVLFERKTWADYASALTSKTGRTWDDQLRKLLEASEEEGIDAVYVLIDGNMGDADRMTHSSINPSSLWGSAASVTARHGIPVIPTGDTDLLIKYAIKLARKHTEDPVTTKGLKASAIGAGEPPVLRMYGCIPGVGPKTARALYDTYPTMAELLSVTPTTIENTVEGVGPKTAAGIYDTLRGEVSL